MLVHKKELIALLPVHPKISRPVFTSVMPNRSPTAVWNWVKVTGLKLGANPTALFGTKKCLDTSKARERKVSCAKYSGTQRGRRCTSVWDLRTGSVGDRLPNRKVLTTCVSGDLVEFTFCHRSTFYRLHF